MRSYLNHFFKDFEYEEKDTKHLLATYNAIIANEDASVILNEILSAYKENISLDYPTEIMSRSKQIADITNLHPYTVDILVFICMSKHLKAIYEERGMDLQIYKDSVLDIKWKLEECKIVKGICGSFVATWFAGFFNMTRFALGRLQFELITVNFDYEKNGVKLIKDQSTVINVHIPRT